MKALFWTFYLGEIFWERFVESSKLVPLLRASLENLYTLSYPREPRS